MQVNAVIVAAGKGQRMGGDVPKPFLSLGGRPMIIHTLHRFAACKSVRKVVLVTGAKEVPLCQDLVRSEPGLRSLEFAFESGGPRRQDSVSRGLARLDGDCEIVVIHDGVRPFVSSDLIDRCVQVAFKEDAVVVGIPVRSTIKVISVDRRVQQTPLRDSLWEIQTPQVFRSEIIREAYQRAQCEEAEATDDAVLVERLGKSVALVEGQATNIKITVREDLLFAETLLREGKVP